MIDGDRPSCPRGCSGRMHRHGRYIRYAHPTGAATFSVPRFHCPCCGLTVSVLPVDRLPYRPLAAPRLEAFFNEQVSIGSGPDPPPELVEVGCLRRAWARLQSRTDVLTTLFSLNSESGIVSAEALWLRMCEVQETMQALLCSLARSWQQSLLGDYACLRVPT